MPQPFLWEALLEISCFVWQLQQMGVSLQRRGAHSEQWPSSTSLLCIQMAPCSCVSAGHEKHLTWHLEMLKDSVPRPEGGRKEPMMLLQTRVVNARRGALPESLATEIRREKPDLCSRHSLRAHVKLCLKWSHLFSIRYDLLGLTGQSS